MSTLIDNAVRETQAMNNPLLAGMFKMPGRIFPLPSRALLYVAGKEVTAEVKDNGGEIHVRPMSAMAEPYAQHGLHRRFIGAAYNPGPTLNPGGMK